MKLMKSKNYYNPNILPFLHRKIYQIIHKIVNQPKQILYNQGIFLLLRVERIQTKTNISNQ